MKRSLILTPLFLGAAVAILFAQSRASIDISGHPEKPALAIPDFRGAGEAQQHMDAFNRTLWNELQNSGQVKMVPKTFYPIQIPQQPADFKTTPQTPSLTQWYGPPVNANWLAFGYTAAQNGQLALYGWLFNVSQPTPQSAQVLGKVYVGTLDDAGAMKVAREFAADILKQFGAKSLSGTKIYFVSERTGHKEIWSWDYDSGTQTQITHYNSITTFPAVSPDNTKVAFMTYAKGQPQIFVHSLESGRKLPFYNQAASMNAPSDFTPDSQRVLFYSSAGGGEVQIFMSNVDGSNLQRISHCRCIDVEPKVNPKTGGQLVFVSDRGGLPQIYRMNTDGSDIVRLTNGQGEATNPSWNPDGQHIAFAWTKGFEPGNYNIFTMDVATGDVIQLTHGEGRNENPSWAPDGIHLVYASKRGRVSQLWTMLADGSGKQQLTTVGSNENPVWSRQ
ncbi:MAG: translocation protein TolB [Bryobacteraceae bacterium]|jgi:TolB protein